MKSTQDKSSTSKSNPNIKLALETKYQEESAKLPQPTGWRILVLPFKGKKKSKGGVISLTNKSNDNNLLRYAETYWQWVPIVIKIKINFLEVHGARRAIG